MEVTKPQSRRTKRANSTTKSSTKVTSSGKSTRSTKQAASAKSASDASEVKISSRTRRKLSPANDQAAVLQQDNEKTSDARVAISAYYKAQARGFEPGSELEDWLAAEAEHDQ